LDVLGLVHDPVGALSHVAVLLDLLVAIHAAAPTVSTAIIAFIDF